jgi:hypothetical protein
MTVEENSGKARLTVARTFLRLRHIHAPRGL